MFLIPKKSLAFSGLGSGTPGAPYIITTCPELQEMKDDLDAHYKLGDDIDCSATTGWNSGEGFTPIGDSYINGFTGTFDGAGHTISHLFMNRPIWLLSGLFGLVENGEVSNVALVDVDITGEETVGGLVAYLYNGTVSNASVEGTVTAVGDYISHVYAGGLIGYAHSGTVSNTYSNVPVTAGTAGYQSIEIFAGGLIGSNQVATVQNSYATGNVEAEGDIFMDAAFAGGFAGYNNGTINNVFATGTAAWTGGEGNSGGLIGSQDGTVTNSFSVESPAVGSGSSTGSTDGQIESDFYEASPLHAVYTGSPSWNFDDIWSFKDKNSFPLLKVFQPAPSPQPVSNSGFSSPSGPSTPTCNDSEPGGIPNLFRIDAAGTYVNLYFSTINGNTGYNITYGLTPEASQFGDWFITSESPWIYGRTIGGLNPNTTYYFKVQGVNGCNAGEWSQTVSVKTKSRSLNLNQWFANLAR